MIVYIILGLLVAVSVLYFRELILKSKIIKEARTDAVRKSRASIEGQVMEQLVPYFPEWTYTPSDARFLGSPLDFIVFDGLSTGKVENVVFVEIKSRNSKITQRQRSVKKAINEGKVSYELIEIKDVREINEV